MYKRKTLKVKDIIIQLRNQGSKVIYRKRKDGGYQITKINGSTFRGAKGNAVARDILGINLTKAQREQRGIAFLNSPVQFNKAIRAQIKRTQKAFKESKEEFFKDGAKVSYEGIRIDLKQGGVDKAVETLKNNELRALGLAYPKNVDALINRINMYEGGEFDEVAEILKGRRHNLPDSDLAQINQVFYAHEEDQLSSESCRHEVLSILNSSLQI